MFKDKFLNKLDLLLREQDVLELIYLELVLGHLM